MEKGSKINYEWCIEGIDEFGDIQENIHSDTLKWYDPEHFYLDDDEVKKDLVLIRDLWELDGNLAERVYATVEGGKLPEFFQESGHRVPKRFHKELVIFNKRGIQK